jgi:hypothetical protein
LVNNTSKLYYRVERSRISLIRFIFEGYDGLAVITTLDREAGRVVLSVAPGGEELARRIMADLAETIMMESCDPPFDPTNGQDQ